MPEQSESEDGRVRPFWSGLLSFGLVSIPVELVAAHRSGGASLRMLDADGTPLARRYYCPKHAKEIGADELVHGYELDNGRMVAVTDEELEALAPNKSREIDLRLFVDRDSIDPLYFERSYFLVPGADSGKAYRLLGSVMEKSRRAGIATFVMRDKEYLIAIFADGGLLRAETLRFEGQVRSSADVGLPKAIRPEKRVVDRVGRAVTALAEKRWTAPEMTDHHAAVRKLAEGKFKRHEDVVKSDADTTGAGDGAEVIDLMEVLRKSLAAGGLASRAANDRAATAARTRTAKRRSKKPSKPRSKKPGSSARRRAAASGTSASGTSAAHRKKRAASH